jgi:23S rRNA (cytidine2498-2'-O)-methyltransferase
VASFLLTLCQPGAERALKAEADERGLTASFQRPGFVTFKAPHELDVDRATVFSAVFARFAGLSLGKLDRQHLAAGLAGLPSRRLHVVATEADDEPAFARAGALREELLASPLERAAGPWRKGEEPRAGELVTTAVLVDDEVWGALHRHGPGRAPFAGGRLRPALPLGAPSRAWLKLEEAARVFGIPFAEGQRALELGSAPGGATRALLDRGLFVIGVDPNEMDPAVLAHPRFTHLRRTSTSVDPSSLPPLDWILLDVNVPPGTALRGALPFVERHTRSLRGLVFTLKLKSWDIAGEVEGWLGRVRAAAPGLVVQARQLSTNGQEICVVGSRTPRRAE